VERGFDDHHIVEATVKALGRALNKAVAQRERMLSTKAKPKVRKK
jgi:imidazoleglycerol-phosphate dehydratase